jgi:hypothetical protein
MRSHRRVSVALSALGSLISAAGARADQSVTAVGTVATGFSDNIQMVPDNAPSDDRPNASKATFSSIAPGLIFAHERPRIAQVLAYTFNLRLYVENLDSSSYSNALIYQAIIPVTPLSEVGINANASQGQLNAFDPAPASAPIETSARGDLSYARAGGTVGYTHQLTRSWKIREGVGGSVFEPTDNLEQIRTRYTLEASSGVTKAFNYDAFTLGARGSYTVLQRDDVPDEEILQAGPELRWVHDISDYLSTDASAGVAYTAPADRPSDELVLPVGSAFLRYTKDRYNGQVGYRRTVATNLLIGETEATHLVEARGTINIPPRDDVSVTGAAGYARGRGLDLEETRLLGDSQRWLADVSFNYEIEKDMLTMGIRFQHVRQVRDDFDPPAAAMMDEIINERTRASQFMVTMTGRWPDRQAVEMEQLDAGRADGGDIDGLREQGRLDN